MNKYLFGIIILSCLTSCKQDPIKTDEIFTLGFEQSRTLESATGNFDISFTDLVEESRCPQGVVCVWAGRVLVEIT